MPYHGVFEREGGQVGVVQQVTRIHVDRRLSPTILAHAPSRVDDAPEPRARDAFIRPPLTPVNAASTAWICGKGFDAPYHIVTRGQTEKVTFVG